MTRFCAAGLIVVMLGGASAWSQPAGDRVFPFDRSDFAQRVNAIIQTKGFRGTFSRGNCDEVLRDGRRENYCEYAWLGWRNRLWWTTGAGDTTSISARPSYSSRFSFDDNAALGLSVVIAAVEEDATDDEVASIVDRLSRAGRSLGSTSSVTTSRAHYQVSVGSDGYTFQATAAPR